jgi:hypothetical protein
MTLFVIGFGVVMFGLGFVLGDTLGWDRCWQALTKEDEWRRQS